MIDCLDPIVKSFYTSLVSRTLEKLIEKRRLSKDATDTQIRNAAEAGWGTGRFVFYNGERLSTIRKVSPVSDLRNAAGDHSKTNGLFLYKFDEAIREVIGKKKPS